MASIEARGLRKRSAQLSAGRIDLHVERGRILESLAERRRKDHCAQCNSRPYFIRGELKVLGCEPWSARDKLMRDASFIADVAVLPRWIRVSQLLDYVAGVHPRFDRAKAENLLAKTAIKRTSKVRAIIEKDGRPVHLATVMAIDARLLVLDEPTLGLTFLYQQTVLATRC